MNNKEEIDYYEYILVNKKHQYILCKAECGTPVNYGNTIFEWVYLGSPTDVFSLVLKKIDPTRNHPYYFSLSPEEFDKLKKGEILFPEKLVCIKSLLKLFFKYYSIDFTKTIKELK